MNWFLYLSPVVSIILVASSGGANIYLENLSKTSYPEADGRPLLIDISLDWAARVGIFNSMFISLFASIAVYQGPQTILVVLGTLVILLIIFIFLFVWILRFQAGHLVSERKWLILKRHWNSAELFNIILIGINIILIIEILIVQILPLSSIMNPK